MDRVACCQSLLLHISRARLCPSLKVPSQWSSLLLPQQGPSGERCLFPEPSFTYPSGSPDRPTIDRDAPFPEPSFICLSGVPSKWNPSRFPTGDSMERVAHFQSLFLCLLDSPLKVLLTKISPFLLSPWERSFPSRMSSRGALPPGSPHRSPTERERERERERETLFPESLSLKVSGKWASLQVSQWGLYGEMPISRAFFYTSPDKNKVSPFSHSPHKGTPLPPPCFQNGAPMEKDAPVSTANGWFILLYLSVCPFNPLMPNAF